MLRLRPLTPLQLTLDIVFAVVFLLLFGPLSVSVLDPDGSMAAGVVVSILLAGALAVRRLSPALSLAVAWAAALLQMACGLAPLPVDLAIFGVLYVTAAYGTLAVFWSGLASALVGALTISVYLTGPVFVGDGMALEDVLRGGVLVMAVILYVAAAFALLLCWTIGALVRVASRARDTRAAQQRAEAETLAEQERVRIARDMHDVVAHSLAVVIAQADGARYAAAADPEAAASALATISVTARAALSDVRVLLAQLRHQQPAGPQPTIADLEGLYAQVRAAGVDLRVTVDPVPRGEPPAVVQLAVYRVLQEALTNALRHGDGGTVDVALAWRADHVALAVRNGLRPGTARNEGGHGLIGMRERAQLAGGMLNVRTEREAFLLEAVLPMGGAT